MAKSNQNDARNVATNYGAGSANRTNSDVFGGGTGAPGTAGGMGAFGPGGLSGARQDAINRQKTTFDAAQGGYTEAQKTGGYDPDRLKTVRDNVDNLAVTGGYDPTQVGNIHTDFAAAQPTGGYNPAQLSSLRENAGKFVQTGGYDQDKLDKIQGGYGNFADTGGFSADDQANFRRRATSGVAGIYNNLGAEAERRRSLTGGLGTGGDISQMARQLSQQQSQAATGAETDLAGQIGAGKLAGLGGLERVQSDLAGKRQSALGGLGNLESDVAGKSNSLLNSRAGFETDLASGKRLGVGAQTGLEGSVAAGRMAGNAGQASLFNTSTGEVSDIGKQILAQYGLSDASAETQMRVLTSLATTPGTFDNILRTISTVSGAAKNLGISLGGSSGGSGGTP